LYTHEYLVNFCWLPIRRELAIRNRVHYIANTLDIEFNVQLRQIDQSWNIPTCSSMCSNSADFWHASAASAWALRATALVCSVLVRAASILPNNSRISGQINTPSIHFFAARCYASAVSAVSVRPSICPSRLSVLLKWVNISSKFSPSGSQTILVIARQHTDARYWYSNSVCPSVCPRRSGIR